MTPGYTPKHGDWIAFFEPHGDIYNPTTIAGFVSGYNTITTYVTFRPIKEPWRLRRIDIYHHFYLNYCPIHAKRDFDKLLTKAQRGDYLP